MFFKDLSNFQIAEKLLEEAAKDGGTSGDRPGDFREPLIFRISILFQILQMRASLGGSGQGRWDPRTSAGKVSDNLEF